MQRDFPPFWLWPQGDAVGQCFGYSRATSKRSFGPVHAFRSLEVHTHGPARWQLLFASSHLPRSPDFAMFQYLLLVGFSSGVTAPTVAANIPKEKAVLYFAKAGGPGEMIMYVPWPVIGYGSFPCLVSQL